MNFYNIGFSAIFIEVSKLGDPLNKGLTCHCWSTRVIRGGNRLPENQQNLKDYQFRERSSRITGKSNNIVFITNQGKTACNQQLKVAWVKIKFVFFYKNSLLTSIAI